MMLGPVTLWVGVAAAQEKGTTPAPGSAAALHDVYAETYRAYDPGFRFPEKIDAEKKKLSSEPRFFTLNLLPESSRANALIEAGKARESKGRFKEAMAIYQKVIDEYPNVLYRVSRYGVFVTITDYCQSRILGFPPDQLAHYRTKHDAQAKEAFQIARKRNSLEGLAHIRDTMLATSYGTDALETLGYSALDKGHFLEALEYFETVWNSSLDARTESPDLALSIALCRKMLGQGPRAGERYGLVGHWKLDEGKGRRAADTTGGANHGTIGRPPQWIQGKQGGALHFQATNGVQVAAARFMDIGTGGSDFSVTFWLSWEKGRYPNHVFIKRGRGDSQMLHLQVTRKRQIHYTVATRSRVWEKGQSKSTVPVKKWSHVAFVKAGNRARIYLDGALDSSTPLKAAVLRNGGHVAFGGGLYGALDDVRLYNRALLDREVAVLARRVSAAKLEAVPVTGEAPLTVAFTCPDATAKKLDCFWEFGDGETGRGAKARHTYGLGGEYTAVLTAMDPKGQVSTARQKIVTTWRARDADLAGRMERLLSSADYRKPLAPGQIASAPNVGADDFLPMPSTTDPLGLQPPVWSFRMPGSRKDVHVYTHPVVTQNSIIYRHKNILYSHSILNGELRWKNDLGGRVTWQNRGERQYYQEDILVQDGMVFTPMVKVGPTLVALDEITGRLKWAYGPMAASTPEEANIRFESAPAGGPLTVFAGYVLDNIEGNTHTDTEYGLIAFDSTTGRLKWRTPICSLRPGLFAAGFAVKRRNRIRSFSSPPVYHQGTVYYSTDAGAVAALDALSGRIKWLMRYPYHDGVHDSTRGFGRGHHYLYLDRPASPMFWYATRPLLVGDHLYVTPIDAPTLFCIRRRDGRILWSRGKPSRGVAHFMGPSREGHLVVVCDGRSKYHRPDGGKSGPPLFVLDPETGKTLWTLPDLIMPTGHVTLSPEVGENQAFEQHCFTKGARPFLTEDNHLYVPDFHHLGWPWFGYIFHLTDIDLNTRKIAARRRYYTAELLTRIEGIITHEAPKELKSLEDLPHKDARTKTRIDVLKRIVADTVPENPHGPFMPFSRVTFERYGVPFELRCSARTLSVVYDRNKVRQVVDKDPSPDGLFARAELSMGAGRLREAAARMNRCLEVVSPEDIDFRAAVNQLLFKVHKELVRAAIRSGDRKAEMANCVGMSQTVTTLADEVETLFAVAEAGERRGEFAAAARQLQSIAKVYGRYEYPVPETLPLGAAALAGEIERELDTTREYVGNPLFGKGLTAAVDRLKTTIPVYRSAVSPLPKTLTVRAGELAVARLAHLRESSDAFAAAFEELAKKSLLNKPGEEQRFRLWEFPGTRSAQAVLEGLLKDGENRIKSSGEDIAAAAMLRRQMWHLADLARISRLQLPEPYRTRLLAPAGSVPAPPLPSTMTTAGTDLEEQRGTAWLLLERRGDRTVRPEFLFLGGRVKKKFDNKFVLYCMDARTDKVVWKGSEQRGGRRSDEIRLRGKGDEPGFFEAFVHGRAVIVHGLYDVLAFDIENGTLLWRFEVPFTFEIKDAVRSGDLLILAGQAETLALYLPTTDPRGEVVWQEKEEGDIYVTPYLHADRLISLRKAPSNLTVRYRGTGQLMGRLALPDLLQQDAHPLVQNGPKTLPVDHDGKHLVVSDGTYYIMIDAEKPGVVWKRLIDANDPSRLPPMRFALQGDSLAVLKQDYDAKSIYMLSAPTGEVLWRTDPKNARSPQPLFSMIIRGDKLYGIRPHAGQGFYFVGLDCASGKDLFPPNEEKGYAGKPEVRLAEDLQGNSAIAVVKDRQDYEIKALALADGKTMHTLKVKAVGNFGEHGRVSATAQNGTLALLGKNKLVVGRGK